MNRLIITFISGLLIAGCGNSPDNKATTASDPKTECYQAVLNSDTVTLKLNTINDSISGILVYDFSEKDRNEGSFTGRLSGDTIFANYLFTSEGINSERQVYFLRQDSLLIEGYASVPGISFENGFVLRRSSCR